MRIENSSLIITLDGTEITLPLPDLANAASGAKVKVWSVPVEYRDDGLFVSVTLNNSAEAIPACDLAKCEILGEIDVDPSDTAKLLTAKEAKRNEINSRCDAAVAAIAASYPDREIQSWPQQVKEAEALSSDPKANAPLLDAIAKARSINVSELASRVLEKMAAYAVASGEIIGKRQAAEDLIDLALTPEEVAEITW